MISYRLDGDSVDWIVFSLDFPKANSKDCYRINAKDTFKLVKEQDRVCSGEGRGPHLAIAICSHGSRDIAAALSRDGKSSITKSLIFRKHLPFPTQKGTL